MVPGVVQAATPELKTRNVLLVTIDGLRWQEVFRGADEAYINAEKGGVAKKAEEIVRAEALADSPEARRRKLMPFLWDEIAARGQIIGNRDKHSAVQVTNNEWISYPGYNELLTGAPDPLIVSNFPRLNPNVSVLEWLDGRPGTAGRVVACATWQVFPAILNVNRTRFPLWVSGHGSRLDKVSPELADIQRWMDDVTSKSYDEHFDAFAYRAALNLIDTHQPRLLYIAFGEPDTWAHGRRYDHYLASTQRCDRFIRTIWERLQSLPAYRGTTTLIITTDHGRGATPDDWTNHGKITLRSNETWIAVLGPDTPPTGEWHDGPVTTSSQIAATVAGFFQEDLRAVMPQVAPPIEQVFPNGWVTNR